MAGTHLTWLDWDRAVVGIASQPFRLSWTADESQVRWHVPDFFVFVLVPSVIGVSSWALQGRRQAATAADASGSGLIPAGT